MWPFKRMGYMATRAAPARPTPKFTGRAKVVREAIVNEEPTTTYLFSKAGVVCWLRLADGQRFSGYDAEMAGKALETAVNAALVSRMVRTAGVALDG